MPKKPKADHTHIEKFLAPYLPEATAQQLNVPSPPHTHTLLILLPVISEGQLFSFSFASAALVPLQGNDCLKSS